MPLPVYDAEHQLQMVREPGSPTLMDLRGDASAAQHAADASGLVLHALVVLPRPENRPGRRAPLPRPRPFLPRAREHRSGRIRCAGPSGVAPWQPASLAMRFPPTLGEPGPSRKRLPAAASGPPGIKRRRPKRSGNLAAMPSRGGGKRRGALAPGWPPRCPQKSPLVRFSRLVPPAAASGD
jgi:hypothetical protein